jgi:4,5-DOPA dioxygenase extradiol
MNAKQPILFLSHGSPMTALGGDELNAVWARLAPRLSPPAAILSVSAHWNTRLPIVTGSAQPETIHDFGGFPEALYQLRYPAPGAPALALRVAQLLEEADLPVVRSPDRGLDHGAWIPLQLMYPRADIPVTQLSLVHDAGPAAHYRLGQALRRLPGEGVLVIGSGSATHNLFALGGRRGDDEVPAWVSDFTDWLADRLADGKVQDLLDYRQRAPHAADNHPTEEHLLPLHVALGAAGDGAVAERIHRSVSYGVLAMDAYAFRKPA